MWQICDEARLSCFKLVVKSESLGTLGFLLPEDYSLNWGHKVFIQNPLFSSCCENFSEKPAGLFSILRLFYNTNHLCWLVICDFCISENFHLYFSETFFSEDYSLHFSDGVFFISKSCHMKNLGLTWTYRFFLPCKISSLAFWSSKKFSCVFLYFVSQKRPLGLKPSGRYSESHTMKNLQGWKKISFLEFNTFQMMFYHLILVFRWNNLSLILFGSCCYWNIPWKSSIWNFCLMPEM